MTGPAAWRAVAQSPATGLAELGLQDDPWAQWARGVLAVAVGDYRSAFEVLLPLATTPADRELTGLAMARVAAGLRQLDEHQQARGWDQRATRTSGQAVIDGFVGLAADAVGASDPASAAGHLSRAEGLAVTVRDHIRISWVLVEIALLESRFGDAAEHGQRSTRLAEQWGSVRHIVKSRLFWGAALDAREPASAADVLAPAYDLALAAQLRPLLWPIVAILGERATETQRHAAGEAVRYILGHLPPGHGLTWAARADIERWRGLP